MPHIRYRHLQFQNAYVYEKCEVPLDNQGLVLIRGLNLDDGGFLGAGKSSIFEVFATLQMGKGGKEEQKDEIVNNLVGRDFSAALSLDVNNHPYEIQQYRKHSSYGNKSIVLDKETTRSIIPSSAAKHPHKWISEQLLGLDKTSFFHLFYLQQRLSNIFLHGTPGNRQKKMTEMFDLHMFDQLYKLAGVRYSLLSSDVQSSEALDAELIELEARLASMPSSQELSKEHQEIEARVTKLQEKRTTLFSALETAETLFRSLEQKYELIQDVKQAWSECEPLHALFDDPRDMTRDAADKIASQYDHEREILALAKDDKARSDRRDILRRKIEQLESVGDPAELAEELADVKSRLRRLQNDELPQAEERIEVERELSQLPKTTAKIGQLREQHEKNTREESKCTTKIRTLQTQLKDEFCPTCKRPYTLNEEEASELRAELVELREQLQRLRETGYQLQVALGSYDARKSLEARLAAIQTARDPVDIGREIRKLVGQERRLVADIEIQRQGDLLEAQYAELEKVSLGMGPEALTKKKRRVERLKVGVRVSRYLVDRLEQIIDLPDGKRKDAASSATAIREELDTVSGDLQVASRTAAQTEERVRSTKAMEDRASKIKEGLGKVQALLVDRACLAAIKAAFGSKGLKQERFEHILREATETTVPAYTSILWPNQTVSLELHDKEGSLQFQLRRKRGTVMIFGMRDLKEKYTQTSSNVLIVDEPFGNLDPQGEESLLQVLQMLRGRFSSIFTISHRPEVIQHGCWDQIWWVIRENDNARLYHGSPPAEYRRIANRMQ
jgi:DNA repair exonuclease SbcCD ATPase subunit